ncbi:hypothetical protein AtubIFM56815_002050 [Aspergillus tubingensis]|uniref:Uncharacterized protein n=1 Tax=Aspergillus tubingensis TaxID=5068 RepID=A0A9W6AUU8_ASPTU|nr:hypothetical protein AtubIFM56815_002050 [Aspergillus tubingensis]
MDKTTQAFHTSHHGPNDFQSVNKESQNPVRAARFLFHLVDPMPDLTHQASKCFLRVCHASALVEMVQYALLLRDIKSA